MIVLTSFKKSKKYNGNKFSVARFQPSGFNYPVLDFLSATDKNDNKLLLRYFDDPIKGYEAKLLEGYQTRWGKIQEWLDRLNENETIILCCWCPYSQATKQQINEMGFFCCHTGIIGKIINKHRPDISIILDEDRKQKLLPRWMPEYLEDEIY